MGGISLSGALALVVLLGAAGAERPADNGESIASNVLAKDAVDVGAGVAGTAGSRGDAQGGTRAGVQPHVQPEASAPLGDCTDVSGCDYKAKSDSTHSQLCCRPAKSTASKAAGSGVPQLQAAFGTTYAASAAACYACRSRCPCPPPCAQDGMLVGWEASSTGSCDGLGSEWRDFITA
eukprot:CAMPEP_0179296574 /NCGR_PEP_ID=MMETSP0797-20121207/45011_1 /TAXON_ID=47934 /ORGANISM="Dinophysis acuminata, Strain DAEP01" /LENGTH=177 /DNA_ID=CAMNT_0021005861 /DNA_START=92 /DNA_END=625 /DNA_ORIENTATION=+